LSSISQGLLKLILPLYAAAITESYLVIGIILAADALGTIFGDVLAGVLLSRLGDKRVMQIGLLVIIGAMVTLSLVTVIPIVVLMLVIFGTGLGLYNVSRHMYLADHVQLANRGRAISLFGGIGRIGQTIGPAIGGFLIAGFGLRLPLLVVVGFAGVTIVVITLLLHSENVIEREQHTPHESLVTTFRDNSRTFVTAGSGQLFAQMTRAGRVAIIPLFADQILGLNPDAIGIILSVSWGLDMLLFYPAGWIMDNLGRKRAIVPSFIIQATGLALIPFTQDFAGLLVAAAIIGLGNGISSGTMMTLGSDLAPVGSRGEFLGVWRLIGDAGATGAPLVIGWIAGLVVLQTAAGVISGTGLIAAGIFAFLVPETLSKVKKKRQPVP
jgi:MFS family permease